MTDPGLYLTRLTIEFHDNECGRARLVRLGTEPTIVLSLASDPDAEDGIHLICQVSALIDGAEPEPASRDLASLLRHFADYIEESVTEGDRVIVTE